MLVLLRLQVLLVGKSCSGVLRNSFFFSYLSKQENTRTLQHVGNPGAFLWERRHQIKHEDVEAFMRRTPWILPLFLFLSGVSLVAQSRSQPWPFVTAVDQRTHHQFPWRVQQDEEFIIKIEGENARKANAERQLAIKNDTAKLLQMANELQAYVDKTNENILSIEVVKKAEQIERLAKSVKEKMKANY